MYDGFEAPKHYYNTKILYCYIKVMPIRFRFFSPNRKKKRPSVKFDEVDEEDLYSKSEPKGNRPPTANKTNIDREKHPVFFAQNRHDNKLYNITIEDDIRFRADTSVDKHWNELMDSEKYIELMRAHNKRELIFEQNDLDDPISNRLNTLRQFNLDPNLFDDTPNLIPQSITTFAPSLPSRGILQFNNFDLMQRLQRDRTEKRSENPMEKLLKEDNYFNNYPSNPPLFRETTTRFPHLRTMAERRRDKD